MFTKQQSNLELDITQASPMMNRGRRFGYGSNTTNSQATIEKSSVNINDKNKKDDSCLELLPIFSKIAKFMCGANACNNISDEVLHEEKRMVFENSTIKMKHHSLNLNKETRIGPTCPLMKESSSASCSSCSKTMNSSSNSLMSVGLQDSLSSSAAMSSFNATRSEERRNNSKTANTNLISQSSTKKQSQHLHGKNCKETNTSIKELKGTYERYRLHSKFEKLIYSIESKYKIKPHFNSIIEKKSLSYCSKNSYAEPMGNTFMVRGKDYLRNKVKVPSNDSLFSLLAVENIPKHKKKGNRHNISRHSSSYVQKLRMACKRNDIIPPFILVINLVLPWGNLCSYFYRSSDVNQSKKQERMAFDKLWNAFLTGNKAFRLSTLKLIPRIVNGPWVVKKAVGSSPVIIGQKLPVDYYDDPNYLEICLDVSKGSQMANSIANVVASKSDVVTVDLGFVLEGKKEEYLPEALLAAFRLNHISL